MMLLVLLSSVLWILTGKAGFVSADCPPGFLANTDWCYVLLPVEASWAESQHYCEAVGSSLAVIDDATEEQFIDGFLNRLHDSIKTPEVWIGATDLVQEGTFVAAKTLEPLTYFNWAPTEPDNLNGHQHCVGLFRDTAFKWDDTECERKLYPLCRRPRQIDTVNIG